MKRAAVYIRMSTDKQEDSPDRQRVSTQAAIDKQGFRFYREYIDEARRGWDDTRPGFRQLLADALEKKFDVIVVDECSRLSRNEPVEFFGEVVLPLKRAGVQLYSVAEGGIQDWNNLAGVILSAVHQDKSSGESKKTAWRVTGKYLERAADGRIDLGVPPYGYKRVWLDASGKVVHEGTHPPEHVRRVRPTPGLVPGEPAEVRVVQFIFDAYANRDMSLRDIGRELERQGVPTPAGNRVWSQNCVGRILREMKYAGYYVFNRVRQGKFYRLGVEAVETADGFATRTGTNPRDAWRVVPDHHEPLVPAELFFRVQDLLAANRKRTTPAPNRGNFLLTKLLVCGCCGSPMAGHRSKSGGEAFYRCSKAMGTAQNHCHNNLVKESEVLDNLLAALEVQFLDPRFLELCCKEAEKMDEEATDRRRTTTLRAELATLGRDIDRARGRLAKVDDEEFEFLNGQIAGWKARKKDVEAELSQADAPTHRRRTEELLHRLEEEIRGLRAAVMRKDPACVRATIRRIIGSVRLGVERRLVGKVKHRYFLVGGDVVITDGTGNKASSLHENMRRGRGGEGAVKYITTGSAGREGEEAGASVNLSPSEPTPCPTSPPGRGGGRRLRKGSRPR